MPLNRKNASFTLINNVMKTEMENTKAASGSCSYECSYKWPWESEPEAYNFILKKTLAQMFSCEFCEISINTFFYETSLDGCF